MFNRDSIKAFILSNIVSIIFIVLAIVGMMLSELSTFFILREIISRISRNSFLVLSLLLPVLAGLGLNFGLVVGAMAGQLAIIVITYYQVDGLYGFSLCLLIALPIAILFGYLTGRLFNATKGQEMIAGLIVSFFANGIYQFVLLILVGPVIPMKNSVIIKPDGVGLRNTIALNGGEGKTGIKYALDGILYMEIFQVMLMIAALLLLYAIVQLIKMKYQKVVKKKREVYWTYTVMSLVVIATSIYGILSDNLYKSLKIPIVTWLVIGLLCLFNKSIMKTKLGQNFRAIGQSQHIAKVAGIHVNRTRIQAIIISTVLAAWGQIIFLQNIGTMNVYGSHMQVALFSIAALLIGGASVTNAKNSHAITGVLLFHMVFIVSPTAGKTLFGDAQIGEFFRAFVVYGVIGISLGLHAWKKHRLDSVRNIT